jgi:hypothetical protein
MLIDVAFSGDRNVIKKEDEKILKYKEVIEFSAFGIRNKSDTGKNRGEWDHFEFTWTIPEQHTRKARS